ncbi:DinB family protein [Alkalicoccus urumqiensis]|uniref:DinB-like domain-containing protein n=1 Tax=Alkalicoccus urumqiensis TaxID=1548213 RepID=A0A2P6MLF3_ALKUR|nr:DinB family protein [Alkalicoccus urumqiensis]PRO67111.1 hypothetical protein C6I21_00655 [Alkalicoccus urumqiensis]
MQSTKQEALARMERASAWAEELKQIEEKQLTMPMRAGKWSIRQTAGHLYYWDRFILESILPAAREGKRVPPFPQADIYNRAALAALEGRRTERILNEWQSVRNTLIEELRELPETTRFLVPDRGEWGAVDIAVLLADHDAHHEAQIRRFLAHGFER